MILRRMVLVGATGIYALLPPAGVRHRWSGIPLIPGNDLGLLWIAFIGWGHDLHSIFIEDVQDVPMWGGIERPHRVRPVAITVKLVLNIERTQLLYVYKRFGFAQQTGSPRGCL